MEQSDKRRFKELVQMLGANYRADVTTPLLQAWWVVLEDIPLAKVEAAMRKAMRSESEFMPTSGKVRELAGKGRGVMPYHAPYLGLPAVEQKRIQASWQAAQLIPGGPPPTAVGELIETFMMGDHSPKDES